MAIINVPDGATISEYVALMSSGDTLSLYPGGTYALESDTHGFKDVPSGASGQLTSIWGNGATVQNGVVGLNFNYLNQGGAREYVSIRDINFVNQNSICVSYDGCNHIYQYDCTYESAANPVDIVKVFRSDDISFFNCTVLPTSSSNQTCDGFEFVGPCNRIRCVDCTAYEINNGDDPNYGHGFEVYGELTSEACDDVKFVRCSAYDNRVGFSCEGGASDAALHTNVVAKDCSVGGGNVDYDYQGIQGATLHRINSPGTVNGTVVDLVEIKSKARDLDRVLPERSISPMLLDRSNALALLGSAPS